MTTKDKGALRLRGEIEDARVLWHGDAPEPASLNRMAKWSLNYLRRNPVAEWDYECRFMNYPSHIPWHCPDMPPSEYGHDVISLADTDMRMQLIFADMRALAGIDEPFPEELGVSKRCLSYVAADGAVYTNPAAFTGCPIEGVWLSPWGTAHQILYDCDMHRRTGEAKYLDAARRAADTVDRLATRRAGMRDLPGATCYRDGEWLKDIGWSKEHQRAYAFTLEPMVRIWEESGRPEDLRRAVEYGEAVLGGLRTDRLELAFGADGSFGGHTHLHTRIVWGMAHLAHATGESRYAAWARRAYDYVALHGTEFGWYPEHLPQNSLVSETCINGDMMAAAYHLAACGELDLYEDLERNWRNYLRCTQFFITPDFEAYFRKLHREKPLAEVEAALESLRALEGGFVAQVQWNDLIQRPELFDMGRGDYTTYMMGCCPPSGMLALEYIRRAAIEKTRAGICVNMTVTLDSPIAKLRARYDAREKLTVLAGQGGDYLLRVPEWTNYDEAYVLVNGKRLEPVWAGRQARYLLAPDIRPGDELALCYPLVLATQRRAPTAEISGAQTFEIRWLGNSVLDVRPTARYIDLFGAQRGVPAREPW